MCCSSHVVVRTLALVLVIGFGAHAQAATHLVTDEATSIQQVIDAASPGDLVLVEAGVYGERIRLKPGITLKSSGDDKPGKQGLLRAEKTILDGGGTAENGPGVSMAEGATLDGFTITKVGIYDDVRWRKHHESRGEQQAHEHIGHFGAPGIAISGQDCVVTNCIVHHNGDTGIATRRPCTPRISHNHCYRNMGGGIGSMDRSTAIIEANVCFENFYAGIGHAGASPMVIGNTCYGNVRAGIGISEGACPVVRGNRCYQNRRAGIGCRTGAKTSPVVENNDCYENDMAGIGCEEHASPIIRHNRCWKNAMAGIGARAGARAIIVGNECYENHMAGIGGHDADRLLVVANLCRENRQAGIGMRGNSSAIVCHNRCVENQLVAIGLPDGARAVIHGNECVRSRGMPPLVAVTGGSSAVVTENTLRGGGVAGLLLEGSADILHNQFHAANAQGGTGIWVKPKSRTVIADNQVEGFRTGVKAAGARMAAWSNIVRDFGQQAIVVDKSQGPAHVYGNRAITQETESKPFMIDASGGIVSDNKIVREADAADR